MGDQCFDVDRFLALPLTARLATAGPKVRPVWFLWEGGSFWIMTGPWSTVAADLHRSRKVAIVVDTCDLSTGECLQVIGRGLGELLPYDAALGRRKLERYLGGDSSSWDDRFRRYLSEHSEAQLLKICPTSLLTRDQSFTPSATCR